MIKTVAVIFIVICSLILFYALANLVIAFFMPPEFKEMMISHPRSAVKTTEEFNKSFVQVGAAYLLFATIWLISAIGILKHKNWARLLLLGFFTAYCLFVVSRILFFNTKYSPDFLIFLGIYVFSLLFFNFPRIKNQFI